MIQETKKQVFDTAAVPALAQSSQRRQNCDTKGNKQYDVGIIALLFAGVIPDIMLIISDGLIKQL